MTCLKLMQAAPKWVGLGVPQPAWVDCGGTRYENDSKHKFQPAVPTFGVEICFKDNANFRDVWGRGDISAVEIRLLRVMLG